MLTCLRIFLIHSHAQRNLLCFIKTAQLWDYILYVYVTNCPRCTNKPAIMCQYHFPLLCKAFVSKEQFEAINKTTLIFVLIFKWSSHSRHKLICLSEKGAI